MLQYDSLEQARMRLESTIITYKGQAVYVNSVVQGRGKGRPIQLRVQPLPLSSLTGAPLAVETVTVSMDDPDANFRLFRVGYQNLVFGDIRRAVFLVRAPVRQQRQGLCERQLFVEGEDATAQRELDLNGNGNYSYRYMLLKSFDDMLAGRYPDLQQAFRMLDEEGWDRVAVSHNFAVGKDRDINALRFVLYRGRKVGVALERPLAFLIDKDNEYLSEALQETGIKFKVNDV